MNCLVLTCNPFVLAFLTAILGTFEQVSSATKERERAWQDQQTAQEAHFSQLIAAAESKMKVLVNNMQLAFCAPIPSSSSLFCVVLCCGEPL